SARGGRGVRGATVTRANTRFDRRAPSCVGRFLVPVALVVTLTSAVVAHAEEATIGVTTGETVTGEVIEVTNGDHVTLRTNGQIRTIAWAQMTSLDFATPAPTPVPALPPPLAPGPSPSSATDRDMRDVLQPSQIKVSPPI